MNSIVNLFPVQLHMFNVCVEVFALVSKRAHGIHCFLDIIGSQIEQLDEVLEDDSSRRASMSQNATG